MDGFGDNAIFWIEVEKIRPNPFQPRREFDVDKLQSLTDSIRQYGLLQPLLVTRREIEREDGSLAVEYELISGERRLRAAQRSGLAQVPALIRNGDQTDKMKLEMAIIENLQREDLNPLDRAQAFKRLAVEFNLKHREIAQKIGRSREYVSNTIRLLTLPEEVLQALAEGQINEGHTRPILMLMDRPQEQRVLFQEIIQKKMSVRDAEGIASRIAYERVRKRVVEPELVSLEQALAEKLGTRVTVERREVGGKLIIDFFSSDELQSLVQMLGALNESRAAFSSEPAAFTVPAAGAEKEKEKAEEEEESLYDIKNFSL